MFNRTMHHRKWLSASDAGGDAADAISTSVSTAREAGRYGVVLAADVLFSVGDIEPIAKTVDALLTPAANSRFVIARSAWFEDLQPTLLAAVETAGLRLVGASVDGEAGAAVLEIEWAEARG